MKIACIGSGNMGYAIMKGVSLSSAYNTSIYFADINYAKACSSSEFLGAQVCKTNTEAAHIADFLFLAIKPQALEGVLVEIATVLQKRLEEGNPPILVSMAPGWSINKIYSILKIDTKQPIVRIMPNTPSLIGKGIIVLSPSHSVPAEKVSILEKLLSGAGIVNYLDESHMDAVTALSGSSPAFVYMFIEALADGGVLAGLPRQNAVYLAAQTVLGSAAMVLETEKHPGELKDMVTSPGGTTIAGISALEERAFRSTVIKAVETSWKRSIELNK